MIYTRTETLKTISEQYSSFQDIGIIHFIRNSELKTMPVSKRETTLPQLYEMLGISPDKDISYNLEFSMDDESECPAMPKTYTVTTNL